MKTSSRSAPYKYVLYIARCIRGIALGLTLSYAIASLILTETGMTIFRYQGF